MKKFIYSFAMVSCFMALASCSSNDADEQTSGNQEPLTLSVGTPSSETRASIADDTYNADGSYASTTGTVSVVWDGDEQLSLWPSTNLGSNVVMKYTGKGTFDNYAYFKAQGYTPGDNETYYVLYPYQSAATCTKSGDNITITANIPHEQKANANSFDPEAAICSGTASSNQKSVNLAHACAFLKIHTTAACQSISVKAKNSTTWYLAGDVNITPAAAGSAIKDNTNKKNTVTLVPGTGNSTIPAGTYLIAIAPGNETPGLTVSVKYSDSKTVTKSSSADKLNLTAGTITNLGTAATE